MKNAIIHLSKSKITPVKVEFPKCIGHYKNIEDALKDIKFFGCDPVFAINAKSN